MISEKLSTDSRRMLQNGVPQFVGFCRCTPCRQRRGKEISCNRKVGVRRCTPCRQRRGKGLAGRTKYPSRTDAPRAGSAEAKKLVVHERLCGFDAPRAGSAEAKRFARLFGCVPRGCTPCRQRRGKGRIMRKDGLREVMHPVQAAPRQRSCHGLKHVALLMHPVQAAPRQSSLLRLHDVAVYDAPRAGSAEAKASQRQDGSVPWAGCTPCRQRRGQGHI